MSLNESLFQNKKSLTEFVSLVLLNNTPSDFYQYVIFFLGSIQTISILFAGQAIIMPSTKDGFSSYVENVSKIFMMGEIFTDNIELRVYEIILVITWIYFGLLLTFLAFIALKYIFSEVPKIFFIILFKICEVHFQILFWIINMILMATLSPKTQSNILFGSIITNNKVIAVLNIVFLTLNLLFGGLTASICIHSFPESSIFASHNRSYQFTTFLLKAIIAPVLMLLDMEALSVQIIFVIIGFTISLTKLILLFREFPFYSVTPMKLATTVSTIENCISIANALALAFASATNALRNVSYINFFLFPIAVKLALARLAQNVAFYVSASSKTLHSEQDIFKKLYAFNHTTGKVKLAVDGSLTIHEVYFFGKLLIHYKICNDTKCYCRIFLRSSQVGTYLGKDPKHCFAEYLFISKYRLMADAVQSIRSNDHLKITLAHLIFVKQTQGISSALSYLFNVSNDLGFFLSVKKSILTRLIQEKIFGLFLDRGTGLLNMKEFVDFYWAKRRFIQLLVSNTEKYLDFWEVFNETEVKIRELVNRSAKMEKEADYIGRLWNNHIEQHEGFYSVLKEAYCSYLSLVRNTPIASENIMRKLAWKHISKRSEGASREVVTADDLIFEDTISLYVSMSKEKLGKILYISSNIVECTGRRADDLKDKPIENLMPSCFSEKHRDILIQHLERSKTSEAKEYVHIVSFIRNKKGNIVPCVIYGTIFPYLQKELIYIAVIKIIDHQNEQMLIDSKGYINGFTLKIGENLNLSTEKNYQLKDICIDFNDICVPTSNQTKKFLPQLTVKAESGDLVKSKVRRNLSDSVAPKKKLFTDIHETFKNRSDGFTSVATFVKQKCINKRDINSSDTQQTYSVKVVPKTLIDTKIYTIYLEPYQPPVEQKIEHKVSRLIASRSDLKKDNTLNSAITLGEKEEDLGGSINDLGLPKTEALKPNQKKFIFIEKTLSQENLLLPEQASARSLEDTPKLENPQNLDTIPKIDEKHETAAAAGSEITPNQEEVRSKKEEMSSNNSLPSKAAKGENVYQVLSEKAFSTTTSGNMNPKFEQAAYSVPKNRQARIIQALGLGFIALCIILQVSFCLISSLNLELIKGNTDVLSASCQRLLQLSEINRRARLFLMINNGIIANTRYIDLGITDAKSLMLLVLGQTQEALRVSNNLVRDSLYKIESNLQNEFYINKITVNNHSSNTFDLITDVIASSKRLSRTPASTVLSNNTDLTFVLRNTVDSSYIDSEHVNTIVKQDNQLKFDDIKIVDLAFLIVIIFFGFVFLIAYLMIENRIRTSRNKLIELFLRLSYAEVSSSLNEVRNFKTLLMMEFSDDKLRYLRRGVSGVKAKIKPQQGSSDLKFRKKASNSQGLNNFLILTRIFSIVFCLVCFVPFVHSFATVFTQSETLKNKIDVFVTFNTGYYELALLAAALYEYVDRNGSAKIRERPIGQEWEAIYSRLVNSQTLLSNMASSGDDDTSELTAPVSQIIIGDLCSNFPSGNIPISYCYNVGKGILKDGLFGTNSFIYMTYKRVKDIFDSSNKTKAAKSEALSLQNLIEVELIIGLWHASAYSTLGTIIKTLTVNEIDSLQEYGTYSLVVYIIFTLILGVSFLYYVWKRIEQERVEWKKVLRKVPFSILISNTALKNYLIKESGFLFGGATW